MLDEQRLRQERLSGTSTFVRGLQDWRHGERRKSGYPEEESRAHGLVLDWRGFAQVALLSASE